MLRPDGVRTFRCDMLDQLDAQLAAWDFAPVATADVTERGRWQRGDALIVVFHDGRISVRGDGWERAQYRLLVLCDE